MAGLSVTPVKTALNARRSIQCNFTLHKTRSIALHRVMSTRIRPSICLSHSYTVLKWPNQSEAVWYKRDIAVRQGNANATRPRRYTRTHMPRGITQCCLPPGRGGISALLQPKLVLDLATMDGCKAELT